MLTLSQIKQRLPYYYESGISLHFTSAPGRGKSTVIAEAPIIVGRVLGKRLGIVTINAAMLTPMHLMGFGVPKHSEDHSEMIFTDPFFWTTDEGKRLNEYDGGIVFIDEVDKADVDVKKIFGEGRLSGRFGPHRLPPGWVVWTAGNRATDRSGSTKELDHEINRRMEIPVADDVTSLVTWMSENGVHATTIAFAESYPQVVFTDGVPEKQGPWMTPRSLVRADHYLNVLRKHLGETPLDEVTQYEIKGMVGQAATQQLFNHFRLEREMTKFEDIVADPDGAKIPPQTAPDARMLICYHLAHKVDKTTIEAVIQYVERLPNPFQVTFLRSALSRSGILAAAPAVQKWVKSNNSLMTMVHSLNAVKVDA